MTARAVTTIDAPAAILGEGPLWSPRERSLYWVDIVGKRVFRYRPDGGRVDAVDLPYAPSALAPCAGGGLLLVTKKGMAWLDFDAGKLDSITLAGIDFRKIGRASCREGVCQYG